MGCFTPTTKTSFALPDYIKKPSEAISKVATNQIAKPFVSYDKPMVAGLADGQTDAMAQLKELLGGGPSVRSIDNVPGTGKAGSTQDYMDPYLEQVLAPILRNINTSTAQNQMNVDAKANMAGAFGDKGHALENAETAQRGTQAIGDATGQAYSNAYNNAMGLKQNDISRIASDKSQQAQLLNEMFGMGGKEQATKQAGLDADFSEFLRQQGFDINQIAKLASIIGGLPTGQANTTTTPSTASSVLGTAASIGSIISAL